MSTRGPQRWCPDCRGQIYFHHAADGADVWYCQGCGKEIAEEKALKDPAGNEVKPRKENHGRPHR